MVSIFWAIVFPGFAFFLCICYYIFNPFFNLSMISKEQNLTAKNIFQYLSKNNENYFYYSNLTYDILHVYNIHLLLSSPNFLCLSQHYLTSLFSTSHFIILMFICLISGTIELTSLELFFRGEWIHN